jgi:putative membrane protein
LELRDLPTLNAMLNTTAAILLVAGYRLVRRRRFEAHKKVMLAALATSAVFLVSYLVYHFNVGSVKFQKTGTIRTVYFAILISHTILAAAVAPMALVTVYRAWTNQLQKHRRLARITLPVWLYVSVTGVAVYVMLYRL